MSTIRVILADDHQGMRMGIRQLLEKAADIQVVGEATNGADAVTLVEQLTPDLLLLDMAMPDMSGVDVAQRLQGAMGNVRILALSAYSDEQYIAGVLENGATGYLTKQEAVQHLLEAVRAVVQRGQSWFSPQIKAKLEQRTLTPTTTMLPKAVLLTNTEQEILTLTAAGLDVQQIAEQLHISGQIVHFHIKNICNKFQVDLLDHATAGVLQATSMQ